MPSPGWRFHTAISSAPTTSSVPQMLRHRPAHHPSAEHVEDDGQIEPVLVARGGIGDVGDSELVRLGGDELALHQIAGSLGLRVALGRVERLVPVTPHQSALRISRVTRLRLQRIPVAASAA